MPEPSSTCARTSTTRIHRLVRVRTKPVCGGASGLTARHNFPAVAAELVVERQLRLRRNQRKGVARDCARRASATRKAIGQHVAAMRSCNQLMRNVLAAAVV